MKKNVLLQKFILMKKTLTITLLAMMLFASCGKSGKNKNSDGSEMKRAEPTASESTEKGAIIKEITYNDFIKNVWDFETYPDSFAYKGKLPCVIDFYATWCGPCKKVAPIMEKLAKEFNGKVIVYKVNVDASQKLSTVLKIKNIPTVFFLREDKQPSYSVGAKDEIYFRSRFARLVK